jgi:hypothetical protein
MDDEAEARRRGFPKGKSFKLLEFDIVLASNEEWNVTQAQFKKQ